MSTADDALQPTGSNPQKNLASLPTQTQCSTFDDGYGKDFVAFITGMVAGKRVRLSIEVNADNAAYTSPGTPLTPSDTNTGGSTNLQLPGDSAPRDDVIGPNGQDPARIVLAADRQSGTLDAWYDNPGYSQKQAQAVVHVSGTWRCAHS